VSTEALILIIAVLGLGGFVKGAIGLGLPLVTVPALAAFLGVPHALAIMMVPLVLTNAWQLWQFRRHREGTEFLARLLPAGVVGIAVGTWALTFLPAQILSLMLGAMIVVYIALSFARPDMQTPPKTARAVAPVIGLTGGALQGSTGIAAPITVTFLHSLRLGREQFIFAVSAMFLMFTLAQTISLAVAGILTLERFVQGWLALMPIALAMPLGGFAAAKFSRKTFESAIIALLAIIAVRLFQTGLRS
jgi:uncharacterized protein